MEFDFLFIAINWYFDLTKDMEHKNRSIKGIITLTFSAMEILSLSVRGRLGGLHPRGK